jgi:hypothetical protein
LEVVAVLLRPSFFETGFLSFLFVRLDFVGIGLVGACTGYAEQLSDFHHAHVCVGDLFIF